MDVSDEAVEKMIAESLDHAFDDMAERLWTEAVSEEQRTVAGGPQRADAGRRSDRTRRSAQDSGVGHEVEAALKSHDSHRLKKANAELDEGTQHLATLLIDRAMAEAAEAQKMRIRTLA